MMHALSILAIALSILTAPRLGAAVQRTTADSRTIELRILGSPGPDEAWCMLSNSGILTLEVKSLPITSAGPTKKRYTAIISEEAAGSIRKLAEAAIRSLDLQTAQSSVADGTAVLVALEAGTVTLTARCFGLRMLAEAGTGIAALVDSINRHLPAAQRLR